jgi:hypothetical protein
MRVRMYTALRRMRTTNDNNSNRWKDARDVEEDGMECAVM